MSLYMDGPKEHPIDPKDWKCCPFCGGEIRVYNDGYSLEILCESCEAIFRWKTTRTIWALRYMFNRRAP